MRGFGGSTGNRSSARRVASSALFPDAPADTRFVEGLLRAAPRGRLPRPMLSEMAASGPLSATNLLSQPGWDTPELLVRAAEARRELLALRAGGAWWGQDDFSLLPVDCVIVEAGLDSALTTAMVDAAVVEYGAAGVVVLSPKPIAGLPVKTIQTPLDPGTCLDRARRIYTAGGELGFLALLAGVPVSSFADAAYTGWDVTDDAPGVARRPFVRSVDEIFAGICLLATRYRDPFHDHRVEFEEALAIVAEWRRAEKANRRIAVCVGMSFWKRRRVAEFVRSTRGVPVFCRDTASAITAASRAAGAIAGWTSRLPEGLKDAAARANVPLVKVEDGFIRSVGLGSDFLPPASLVFDTSGMYFDPSAPSDLERILRDTQFSPALLARAARLAAQLVARGVTKYNLAAGGVAVDLPSDRPRVLVPGQVEDDMSIRLGGGTVRTNLSLLAHARAASPDAYILYKPHPDVLAGHRVGAVPEAEALRFADVIAPPVSTAALLDQIDELHTITSLAGFEALLRGRRVVVYGKPFYAGWGLTDDKHPIDRGRRLTLAELVAGTLILYPRYLDPLTRLPCGPEVIIERLDDPELWRPGPLVLARRLQGMLARRLGEVRAMLPIAGSGPARGLRERPRP